MSFGFPLLCDPEHVAGAALEAERDPDDKSAAFPRRLTYLVDPEGLIRHSYDLGRQIVGHAEQVLADLRASKQER
jgi:peroxiredoxin